MNTNLWSAPVPLTAIMQGPFFEVLAQRRCEIRFSVEGEDGSAEWLTLGFEGVEAFKCTYLTSLGSVDRDLRKQAYGTVISIESSRWLTEVQQSYTEYCRAARVVPNELRHLMICFDDGPCYEFICSKFGDSSGSQQGAIRQAVQTSAGG